jgi:DNA invertase Pin-like site-specific DNA recombinase
MITEAVSGMDIHAGVYARQSDARENKSEASTTTQRAAGIGEANRRNATRIELYEDLGKSAFKADVVRKDFDRLVADCRAGRINMIVVYYISRLSRLEPLDAIPIVTELLNLGVTIVSVTEGEFRKGNLMDLIHLIMRLDAAHSESKNKSVAVSGAKRAARELGGYVGGTAGYGFTLKPETRHNAEGRPIVVQVPHHNEREAAVIRDVWSTIRRHLGTPYTPGQPHPGSLSGICVQMNANRVPTRGQSIGKERAESAWSPGTLKRILMDPRLAGFDADPVYGNVKEDGTTSRRVTGYRIRRDPHTMEPIAFAAPIIPPAEWSELQEWLGQRGRGKGLTRKASLLSGLRTADGEAITTCECDRPMGSLNSTNDVNRPSYRCTRPKGRPIEGVHDGGNTIVQEYLDEYVARRIFALIQTADSDPDTLEVLAEATRRFARTVEAPETAQERSRLVAERADAVQALNDLYDDREAGGYGGTIGRQRFLKQEAALETRMSAAEARLADLEAADNPTLPLGAWMSADADVDPLGEGSWWHGATLDARRAFVALFVERITVRKASRRGGRTWTAEDVRARVAIAWARPQEDV